MSRNVKLGLIQMTCTDDKQSNIDKAVANIESLARSGAQIICTQELYQTPYFCQVMDDQVFKLAQEIHVESEIIRNLGSLAADSKSSINYRFIREKSCWTLPQHCSCD